MAAVFLREDPDLHQIWFFLELDMRFSRTIPGPMKFVIIA